MAKLTLDQKLNAIYKQIAFIGKGGENTSQHYKYVRASDVTNAVRAAFVDNNIYAEVNVEFVGAPYTIARAKDPMAPYSAVNARCTLILHDLESDETRTASGIGSGADLGDKAAYKAETGALKYALRNALLIPDEAGADEPENDEEVGEDAPVKVSRPKQQTEVFDAPDDEPTPAELGGDLPPATGKSVKMFNYCVPPEEPEPEMPAQVESAVQQREPGDESEPTGAMPADDGTLPTEEEKNEFRARFNKLVDSLSSTKALTASKGLKVDKKFLVFALKQNEVERIGDITAAQWKYFLGRAEAISAMENGWVKLAKVVNAANGVEK